jgi:hypothetical protein
MIDGVAAGSTPLPLFELERAWKRRNNCSTSARALSAANLPATERASIEQELSGLETELRAIQADGEEEDSPENPE